MTSDEAYELQKKLDLNLIEFYKDKPLEQSDIDYFDAMVEKEVRNAINVVVDNYGKPNYSTRPLAWFVGQWYNSKLNLYLVERGFKIHPDGNGTDIWATW